MECLSCGASHCPTTLGLEGQGQAGGVWKSWGLPAPLPRH